MPNHGGIGHNKPPAHEDIDDYIVEGLKRVSDHLEKIPAKWIITQQDPEKVPNECCRTLTSLSYERRKTDLSLNRADLVIFHCDCGRKHRRLMLGGPGEK